MWLLGLHEKAAAVAHSCCMKVDHWTSFLVLVSVTTGGREQAAVQLGQAPGREG